MRSNTPRNTPSVRHDGASRSKDNNQRFRTNSHQVREELEDSGYIYSNGRYIHVDETEDEDDGKT